MSKFVRNRRLTILQLEHGYHCVVALCMDVAGCQNRTLFSQPSLLIKGNGELPVLDFLRAFFSICAKGFGFLTFIKISKQNTEMCSTASSRSV